MDFLSSTRYFKMYLVAKHYWLYTFNNRKMRVSCVQMYTPRLNKDFAWPVGPVESYDNVFIKFRWTVCGTQDENEKRLTKKRTGIVTVIPLLADHDNTRYCCFYHLHISNMCLIRVFRTRIFTIIGCMDHTDEIYI